MTLCRYALWLCVSLAPFGGLPLIHVAENAPDWLSRRLDDAGDNRAEIEAAFHRAPAEQQASMRFLIEHMPSSDLRQLTAAFLLEHVALAHEAKAAARWGASLPEAVFLNNVLPYANVNERRDDVRGELRQRFWPVVQALESPSLAAAKLNQTIFRDLGVKYSTQRRRADQGPRESMETGLASCTGLSILLIDACRACGIPARFVGTPLWSDGSGNHSWVEIWDEGWHFTGAAEATGDALDQAWFTGRASTATPDDPRHGIYAVSYQRTELKFPLVWARGDHEVFAVDVTERYARPQKRMAGLLELRFRALQPQGGDRCQANLIVKDQAGEVVFRGQTKDESFDANDHLTAQLKPGKYTVELKSAAGLVTQPIVAEADGQLVTLETEDAPSSPDPIEELRAYCQQHPTALVEIAEQPFASLPLSREQATAALQLLAAQQRQRILATRQAEHDAKAIRVGELEMKYGLTRFGEAPAAGHCLVISMHGGGGAPPRVNDQQWENQQRLYQLDEGIYVAPRAPTDTWNLWHQAHIDALFTRLIENMIAFEQIDPNRVYITGYSAGGDGVYQLAPRMADQLAAAAMMAGHPNETQPLGLRNLPFTLHVGGDDAAYNRNRVAAEWKTRLEELQAEDPAGYVHWAKLHEGKGHWMDRQDAEGIQWMLQHRRNLIPDRVVWLQDDVLHQRFYWLAVDVDQAQPRQQLIASRSGQHIAIEPSAATQVTLLLRDDMLDLDQPLKVTCGDRQLFSGRVERTMADLVQTLADRGDPTATFAARLTVELPPAE